jgi:hypothetical protein
MPSIHIYKLNYSIMHSLLLDHILGVPLIILLLILHLLFIQHVNGHAIKVSNICCSLILLALSIHLCASVSLFLGFCSPPFHF